ncbi:hypothetical protein HanXRQr2_Chr12g0558701 [Helianthus annuus]|uniref:Uncharacterized protein n=1 Tax=Helianthus annuus TaxID=4232 RepID=A0A251T7H1_HELAN|nr:hypothetical protein HanXRQr2_Chr12g0558701 [Helianthus annuus]KAJ0864108.1 hypothetical protein HanPSC8_Chr12g0537881 [Helianthus annuus]
MGWSEKPTPLEKSSHSFCFNNTITRRRSPTPSEKTTGVQVFAEEDGNLAGERVSASKLTSDPRHSSARIKRTSRILHFYSCVIYKKSQRNQC